MSMTASEAAALLAARASAVIPGGVNSGQRRVPGLEELIITATSGSTFTDGDGRATPTTTPPSARRSSGTTTPMSTRRRPPQGAGRADGVGVTRSRSSSPNGSSPPCPRSRRCCSPAPAARRRSMPSALARTATGRRHVIKFQGCYHGWHDSVAMNVISPAERIGSKDPLSRRHAARGRRRPRSSAAFNDADAVERALDEHDGRRRDHPRADPAQHRRCAAAARLPRAAPRARDEHGTVLVFDEVITGFRHGLGGYQADRRRHARPDDARQGDGERLARLGARRQGGADGSLLHHARAAGLLRRHVQRASGDDRRRAGDDREARARARARARLPPRRARPHGLHALYERSACRPSSPASARSSSPTSSTGPVESYDDLLRNDVDLFIGYRRELMKARHLRAAAEPEAEPLLVRAHRRRRRPAARGDRGRGHGAPGTRA